MKFPTIRLIAVCSALLLASCATTIAPDGTKTTAPDGATVTTSVTTAGHVIISYLESRKPRVIDEK